MISKPKSCEHSQNVWIKQLLFVTNVLYIIYKSISPYLNVILFITFKYL